MRKYFKIGGLLLLIALPIFLVIVLHTFGENKYSIKTYFPVSTQNRILDGKNVVDTSFYQIPNFTLIDQNAKLFSQEMIKGDIYVADFFFTTCGGICPKMTSQLQRVQERFASNPHFKIVSITVDPDTDSSKVLKHYANQYKAKDGFWYFLTGDAEDIYKIAKVDFRLNAMDNNVAAQEDFVHSDKLVLVDANRNIRGYYDGTNPEEVDRLMIELDILVNN
jgi:protein SCO1